MYFDFRYLRLKSSPSLTKCLILCTLASLILSIPYFLYLPFKVESYVNFSYNYDENRVPYLRYEITNPYTFDAHRLINQKSKDFATDILGFFGSFLLWTILIGLLFDDPKKRWQISFLSITLGFTLPALLFFFSIIMSNEFLDWIIKILIKPVTFYIILGFVLGTAFNIKCLFPLLLISPLSYAIGDLLSRETIQELIKVKIAGPDLLLKINLTMMTVNLIWGIFIGMAIYFAFEPARNLSRLFAHNKTETYSHL